MKHLPDKIIHTLFTCGILFLWFENSRCSSNLKNQVRIENEFSKVFTLEEKSDFWGACSLFFRIYTSSKDCEEIQIAGLHLGCCFDSLCLFNNAKDIYKTLLKKFPESPYRVWYHTGILDIDFKLEYYDSVHIRYNNCLEQGLKLPAIAKLINGESFYNQENYIDALKLFTEINSGTGIYCKAGSLLGLSYYKSGDSAKAFETLNHIFTECASCEDEVALALGYLHYGKDDSTTLGYFNRILDTSIIADEALIGSIWYSLKVRDFMGVDSLTSLLQRKYPNSPYWCESYELKAYGFAMQKKHSEAQKYINVCTDLLKIRWPEDSTNNQRLRDSLLLVVRQDGISDSVLICMFRNKTPIDIWVYVFRNTFKKLQQVKTDAQKFHRYSPRRVEFLEPFDRGPQPDRQKSNNVSKSEKIDDELEQLKRELEKLE